MGQLKKKMNIYSQDLVIIDFLKDIRVNKFSSNNMPLLGLFNFLRIYNSGSSFLWSNYVKLQVIFKHWTEICCFFKWSSGLKIISGGRSQDSGGIGRGDHFLFYKFIERTTERWTKFTKQLLILSSGHQAPRKAAHCLRREVGQKY